MTNHLDHNGSWVLLIYALAAVTLIAAAVFTLWRTRNRKKQLDRMEEAPDGRA